MYNTAVYQWLTHIILVNQEGEIRGLQFADSLGKKLRRTYLKKKKKTITRNGSYSALSCRPCVKTAVHENKK
jgi:hypothetical protein